MDEGVTIVLPLPSPLLSPNRPVASFAGRIIKSAAVKKYRHIAKVASERSGIESKPWKKAVISFDFYWPVKRRRDVANAEASLKPAIDGIVDSGLILDDCYEVLSHGPSRFFIDKDHPRVEVNIGNIG